MGCESQSFLLCAQTLLLLEKQHSLIMENRLLILSYCRSSARNKFITSLYDVAVFDFKVFCYSCQIEFHKNLLR